MRPQVARHDQLSTKSRQTRTPRSAHCQPAQHTQPCASLPPFMSKSDLILTEKWPFKQPQSGPPVVQPCAASLTARLVTFRPNTHSTILQPYMLHSVKIWAAFPPYFWVSIFSLLPYTCNRSRIGSKCCLHGSFRLLCFYPSNFG